jgi:ubiquinone/menaquinone biosynthesis C-methylase UbiE
MDEITAYYNQGREQNRLAAGTGSLEQVRTLDILSRFLPKTGVVMDIGGGAGVYALPLAKLGYQVHLVDLIPLHVEQAQQASAEQPDFPLASVHLGDARHLYFEDNTADAALLFGPLYHLTEREDRVQALKEAYRILKPGGQVFVATISRFATVMDGFKSKFILDDQLADSVKQTLLTGQHRNPTQSPGYFTTAYFHTPEEVPAEIEDAGFTWKTLLAVESVAWMDTDFEVKWSNPVIRERILELLRMVETEETFIGASSHIITIGQKSA